MSFDYSLYFAQTRLNLYPFSATITLHNPYIDFADNNNVSMNRCVTSAKEILKAFYRLSRYSIDVTKLHPFVTVSGTFNLFYIYLICCRSVGTWPPSFWCNIANILSSLGIRSERR